ncbi:terpene cyclase/mutase family protein [Streptomyces sp. RY43-2]|uniref:Terpene cyclase/mutase family protein n=1 Tax=Streptomyces macrolidinus TaxID=2952607 RepID=A0ABT0ZJ63_9ACTN|nr:prenyltransferase/squalene oxidase repeat-containing protein [Streptomyces macrolidinus]MCN9243585.1 terpene cyclase/mutase family protein [Streptomyces macrolidinus]
MNVRRTAAVLAAIAVLGGASAPAASAASPSPSAPPLPAALYGTADPTYDGVWRQSLALLAQHTVGVRPAVKAVDWLAGQQCANGAFAAYRADPKADCDAKTQVDTNSTAAAVQALAALGGHDAQTGKAVEWLKSVQNEDGGWGFTAGGASDTNSTSTVVGALAAVGAKPQETKSAKGHSPYDALTKLSLPCDGKDGGAFAYQPDKKGALAANADATAAGALAALGKGFVSGPGKTAGTPTCTDADTATAIAHNGTAYLAGALEKTPYLKSAMPGATSQPDYGNTADAVVALAAAGLSSAAEGPLAWLEKNAADWAEKSGPAGYAQLVFAAHATGTDPRAFGTVDLVDKLGATGPAPQSAGKTATDKVVSQTDSGNAVWWFVGVFLVAGIGIGFLLSGRNRKRQP